MNDAARADERALRLITALAIVALGVLVGVRLIGLGRGQLRVGHTILHERSFLRVETLSYSMEGQPWAYKDIGGHVVLYLAWAIGGYLGLVVLKSLCGVAACLGFRRMLPGAGPVPYLVASAVYLAAIENRLATRPLMISLCVLPLFLALLEQARGRLSERDPHALVRVFVPIVVFSEAWFLLHRGAIVGMVLSVGFAVYAVAGLGLRGRTPIGRLFAPVSGRGALAACGSALAVLVTGVLTPNGLSLYRTAFALSGVEEYKTRVSEWQALGLAESWEHFPVTVALAVLAPLLWFSVVARASRETPEKESLPVDAFHLGMWGLFLWLGSGSVRWYSHLALSGAFIVGLSVRWLLRDRWAAAGRDERAGWVGGVALVGVVAVAALNTHPFGVGPRPDRYPEGAIAFAREHGLDGRPANAFVYGGYLLWEGWPDFRPYIDGRNDMVYPPAFFVEAVDSQLDPTEFARLREEWGWTWVLASNAPGFESHEFLASDPAWWMVYWSEPAVIYVRAESYPELEATRFRYAYAPDLVASIGEAMRLAQRDARIADHVLAELERMRAESPDSVRALSVLVLFYHTLGPRAFPERDATWEHLTAVAPEHPAVQQLAERLGLPL